MHINIVVKSNFIIWFVTDITGLISADEYQFKSGPKNIINFVPQ